MNFIKRLFRIVVGIVLGFDVSILIPAAIANAWIAVTILLVSVAIVFLLWDYGRDYAISCLSFWLGVAICQTATIGIPLLILTNLVVILIFTLYTMKYKKKENDYDEEGEQSNEGEEDEE